MGVGVHAYYFGGFGCGFVGGSGRPPRMGCTGLSGTGRGFDGMSRSLLYAATAGDSVPSTLTVVDGAAGMGTFWRIKLGSCSQCNRNSEKRWEN